jgi:site-specific recombinase XerD
LEARFQLGVPTTQVSKCFSHHHACTDHVRPAAVKVGILTADDTRRFGFHNLRHSLASFLVSVGTNPKVVQGLLRHSDVHTTLQLYSQSVSADRLAAQGAMLDAMGVRPELVN